MIALERTATLRQINGKPDVVVKAKPFGGGVRITSPQELKHYIGEFNYDSELSKQEKDFRVLVRPESWVKIKGICREHLTGLEKTVIDISPNRELSEEFEDSLRIKLTSENYYLKLLGMAIEEKPDETENIRSKGIPTVRVY
ncbi:MAG: hypothetical protein WCE54_18700, partial [Ignavibacteriaceae bacterium]